MKLKDLLIDVEVVELHADPETEISAICYDSRKACEGALFVAVKGYGSDGFEYIVTGI
ncbi:MAG: hypothetical protein HUJ65_01230 [Oscillospiraceae bacterium]|nr:hypothetical protein [Oscillospiraceae bacterium]